MEERLQNPEEKWLPVWISIPRKTMHQVSGGEGDLKILEVSQIYSHAPFLRKLSDDIFQ